MAQSMGCSLKANYKGMWKEYVHKKKKKKATSHPAAGANHQVFLRRALLQTRHFQEELGFKRRGKVVKPAKRLERSHVRCRQ